jgi:hypothetical protein
LLQIAQQCLEPVYKRTGFEIVRPVEPGENEFIERQNFPLSDTKR